MPFRDPERHLRDILESIDRINEFIGDMGFSGYQQDEKTRAAVERKMQILTKAVIRLEMAGPRLTGQDTVAWETSCGIPTIDPLFDSLRPDHRFRDLRERIGFLPLMHYPYSATIIEQSGNTA